MERLTFFVVVAGAGTTSLDYAGTGSVVSVTRPAACSRCERSQWRAVKAAVALGPLREGHASTNFASAGSAVVTSLFASTVTQDREMRAGAHFWVAAF